jgi:opacity protein-like surface antigen
MRPLFLLLLGAASAFAQPFTFGVKAGVPLTDFYSTVHSENFGFNSNTKRYVVGPTVELRLPFGLGIEFDALYRRASYSGAGVINGLPAAVSATGNAWEFPLLAKYRFPVPVARPFIDAGIAWDRLGGVRQSVLRAVNLSEARDISDRTTKGFVMGAGIDIHLGIHISPEIRYTRWGSTHFVDPVSLVRGSRNQAEFLLGITF